MFNPARRQVHRLATVLLPLLLPIAALAQSVTSLSVTPSKVFGGDPSVGTVRINQNAGAAGFTVNLSSTDASAKVPATVVVPAGKQSASFTVSTIPVSVDATSQISGSGGGGSASFPIRVLAPVPKSVAFSPNSIPGGVKCTGVLTLTQAAATNLSCRLTSDSNFAQVPASVTVLAGSKSAIFTVNTIRTPVAVTAKVTATLGSLAVTGSLPVLPVGLDISSPWAKFHGDAQNTGYSYNGVASPEWRAAIGSPILSSPAIGLDGTVYVGANNGYLYALKGTDGSVLWKYKTAGRVVSSPVVTKTGVVFVGSADKSVYAINGTNGTKLWSYKTGGAVTSSPCIGADGLLYVGSYDGYVYALSQATGTARWVFKTGGAVTSSPNLSSQGILFVGSNDNSLYAIDTITRAKLWSYATGGDVQSSPALAGGNVYFGSFDGRVYALKQSTGARVWSFQTDWTVYSSPCVDSSGTVYVGSDDGNVYSLNGATGSLNWSYLTDDCVGSSPALDLSGNVYVGSDDGNLYSLRAASGLLVQFATQTGAVESSPAIVLGAAIAGVNTFQGVLAKSAIGYPGYTYNPANGHWYKAVSVPAGISWTNAEKAAEAEGGHLATITSQAENEFVSNLCSAQNLWVFWSGSYFGPWLGGKAPVNRSNATDGWQWVTVEQWLFTKWRPGEPSNGGRNENCLQYARTPSEKAPYGWNDVKETGEPSNAGGGVYSYVIEIDGFRPRTP